MFNNFINYNYFKKYQGLNKLRKIIIQQILKVFLFDFIIHEIFQNILLQK